MYKPNKFVLDMYSLVQETAAVGPQFEQLLFKILTYYSGWCMFIELSNVLQVPLEVMSAGFWSSNMVCL